MQVFKDRNGRPWSFEINIGSIAVGRIVGVDIATLHENDFQSMNDLFRDPVRLADLIYTLSQHLAPDTSVTIEQFRKAIDGDVLEAMGRTFLDELGNFIPPRSRQLFREIVRRTGLMIETEAARDEKLLMEMTDEEFASILKKKRGEQPASSESIPEN